MKLLIAKITDPPTSRPWRLIEVYITSDGYRTRICEGNWATEAEVQEAKRMKERLKNDNSL